MAAVMRRVLLPTNTTIRASTSARDLHTSHCLRYAMAKQAKLDPAIARVREERKRRNLARDIREFLKHSKKPKPLDEMQIDIRAVKTIGDRVRAPAELSFEECERRALARKAYGSECNRLWKKDQDFIRTSIANQREALTALRDLSEELYQAAIQPDHSVLRSYYGPPETQQIADYECPDGDYIDTTRTWT